MRTLELIRVLTDRELIEFEVVVNTHKRKSLQLTYEVLKKYRKRSDTPDNEELFQRVFEKKYTSDKNYLLRNELRLLNDTLYEYLIEKTFSSYIKKHKSTYYAWLARTFFERKLTNAFDADIDRFIEYAKEYVKPEDGALLHDLKSLSMIYTQEKNGSDSSSANDRVGAVERRNISGIPGTGCAKWNRARLICK